MVKVVYRRADGPLILLVGSEALCIIDPNEDGERRKVYLAVDTATSGIHAAEFTPSREGESPFLPGLLHEISEDKCIGTVTAGSAYETRRCHSTVIARSATPIIPILKNGRLWK